MSDSRNPQAQQMGDESMVRNLAFQADAIWPQESPLFDRYALHGTLRILDVGCGTGEITRRLARRYPQAQLCGIDILDSNLQFARRDSVDLGARVDYEVGDAFALRFPNDHFDLIVCRHMSQAVPDFALALKELTRVLKPGGWIHLLSEDYSMLHIPNRDADPELFWVNNAQKFLSSIGCDGRIGRRTVPLLEKLNYENIGMEYLTIDTLRVPRATFAGILEAWRDGYVGVLAAASGRAEQEVEADFNAMIAAIQSPTEYAVWQVPVASGMKPKSDIK
jgi:ubiquinone/menaquinone biosynthesis C-methylase UbiE